MNKADLIDLLQKEKDPAFANKAQAERCLDAVLGAIKKGLKKSGAVRLINFGTFEVRKRKKRKGQNPRTGEQMMIPPSRTVAFRVGKQLKDAVS
jgi:DNA-binding protein HU-beta